jgi:hypothetical protein
MWKRLNWLLYISEDAGMFTIYLWREDQIFKYHLFYYNFDLIIPPLTNHASVCGHPPCGQQRQEGSQAASAAREADMLDKFLHQLVHKLRKQAMCT